MQTIWYDASGAIIANSTKMVDIEVESGEKNDVKSVDSTDNKKATKLVFLIHATKDDDWGEPLVVHNQTINLS